MGNYTSESMDRDLAVLKLLESVPLLDPLLWREHLRNHEVEDSPCYFAISEGDQERMHRFVASELARLVALAGGGSEESTNRMVQALLSSRVDKKLEPVRAILGLTGNDFREGFFSWRGFFYYKMVDGELLVRSDGVRHINVIVPHGSVTPEQRVFLQNSTPRRHPDGARQWRPYRQVAGDL